MHFLRSFSFVIRQPLLNHDCIIPFGQNLHHILFPKNPSESRSRSRIPISEKKAVIGLSNRNPPGMFRLSSGKMFLAGQVWQAIRKSSFLKALSPMKGITIAIARRNKAEIQMVLATSKIFKNFFGRFVFSMPSSFLKWPNRSEVNPNGQTQPQKNLAKMKDRATMIRKCGMKS